MEAVPANLELSADIIDYHAQNAERFLAPEYLKPSSGEAVVESSPIAVGRFVPVDKWRTWRGKAVCPLKTKVYKIAQTWQQNAWLNHSTSTGVDSHNYQPYHLFAMT
jgi:hypothetical protein